MSLLLSCEANYPRRGIIAPLAAVLMVFLLGMVAFTVDIAWMVLAQTELQNVADAAALAGAQPLMDNYPVYAMSKITSNSTGASVALNNARTQAAAEAKKVAAANVFSASGAKKNYVLADVDIEFGVLDSSNNYTQAASGVYPNSIKVTMRRSSGVNESLSLFFGPVLGKSTVDLTNVARASIFGTEDFIEQVGNKGPVLPVTYDKYFWDEFWTTGIDPDSLPDTTKGKAKKKGAKLTADDGTPRLHIYQNGKESVYKGNFGMLSLNDSAHNSAATSNWVENGLSQADFDTLLAQNLIPISKHAANTWDWQGSPGFDSSVVQNINDHMNKPSLMPLFQAKNFNFDDPTVYQPGVGEGSGYDYNIVGFAPIKIVGTPGDNQNIYIQPAAYIASDETVLKTFDPKNIPILDPTKVSASIIFTYPKLTQ